jgi:hypothetical protein
MIAPVNLHKFAETLPAMPRLVHMKCSRRAGQPDASLGEPPAQGLTTNVHTMQLHQFLVCQFGPKSAYRSRTSNTTSALVSAASL